MVKVERVKGSAGFLQTLSGMVRKDPQDPGALKIALKDPGSWSMLRRLLEKVPGTQVIVDRTLSVPSDGTFKGEVRKRPWILQNLALLEPNIVLVEVTLGGLIGGRFLLIMREAAAFKYLLYRAWLEAWE